MTSKYAFTGVLVLFLSIFVLSSCGGGSSSIAAPIATPTPGPSATYQNPLSIKLSDGTYMESCPDPTILKSQTEGDNGWYLYCTNEEFHDGGTPHLMAISRSEDLVNWNYVGDVFSQLPAGAAAGAGLWAPDVDFFNGKYYIYFSVSQTVAGGSAIFVASSNSPAGPWSSATQVVEPEPANCCGGQPRSTIDPEMVTDTDGSRYLFFGSYYGGIFARKLSDDGLSTLPATEVQIALDNRYEASYVVKKNGYFYLMVSSGNCCAGPLSGYGVFAARSENVLGPYVDRDGHSLLESRIGGTPVMITNGNQWVGPGHNGTVSDANGQDWIIYHAVNVNNPTYASNGETRRPVMMDELDWINEWPVVRGGAGPSNGSIAAPAVTVSSFTPATAIASDAPGSLISAYSDEFIAPALSPQWQWHGSSPTNLWSLSNGQFQLQSQAGDITNTAMLTEAAPSGNYMVEVKLSTNVPLSGVYNYVQGGVLLYKDNSNFVKLGETAIGSTRQIEFGKQMTAPGYGYTVASAPGDSAWIRLVKRTTNGQELYTSYSSQDGTTWERGGTWTHSLGTGARLGLFSMAGAGFTVQFDYVRVYNLAN